MTISKSFVVMAVAALCGFGLGCSDTPDENPAGSGGAGGTTGGTSGEGGEGGTTGGTGGDGGTTGGMGGSGGMTGGMGGMGGNPGDKCVNPGADNLMCPDLVGPFEGDVCAPKGECCHRSSNATKLAALGPDEPAIMEWRVSNSKVLNHPKTTGAMLLLDAAAARAKSCAGEQCLLWRFEWPRMGGELVAGTGESTSAIGRYNCDGTFSYYDDTVAPARPDFGFENPARWNAMPTEAAIDPALEGVARTKVAWATHPGQNVTCSPFFLPNSMEIDWELCTSGFEILEFDTSEEAYDCQGSYSGSAWTMPGVHQSFAPLADNNKDIINATTGNFCQLLSFGLSLPDPANTDCLATPRCMPGTADCLYVKLPDALCPTTDDEREMWRCHLGAEGNPNMEDGYPTELNCTAEAVTAALDPDMGATSKGQCCDPLGADTNGLPACNAFRLTNEYAAAAAEITDDKKNTLPPICD
jgi:hypothetical protein